MEEVSPNELLKAFPDEHWQMMGKMFALFQISKCWLCVAATMPSVIPEASVCEKHAQLPTVEVSDVEASASEMPWPAARIPRHPIVRIPPIDVPATDEPRLASTVQVGE